MPNPHIAEKLDGYLDREFDLATSLEIERHLEGCAQCRSAYEQRKGIIARVIAEASYHRAPEGLRNRVLFAAKETDGKKGKPFGIRPGLPANDRPLGFQRWLILAASLVMVAGLSSGATFWLTRGGVSTNIEEEVVASHIRSLLVENRLTDVASSDEHTVKPWFNRRLDFAPPVDDWTAEGYPLVGGRLDYLGNRTVAALVYRHRQHFVNLFVWPDRTSRSAALETINRQGYALVRWSDGIMAYWAISDLNSADLLRFCEQLRAKTPKQS